VVIKVCGYRMEEETIVIVILGVMFMAVFTFLNLIKRQNPVKKAQKRNEMSLFDNLTDYREVEKSTIADILKQKDSQIKSLNIRLKQFEPLEEEDQSNKGVSWEQLQALVKQSYPKYSMMMLPFKKQIMETTKGMSLEEIITYVKELTGNKESQGQTDPQSLEYRKDWA